MRIIGLDVGEKRIGVAKADSSTRIAVPVGFIEADGSEWQKLAHAAKINNTTFFVVGLPRSNEGNETKQSLYVRKFAKLLTEKIPGAKVRFQDESLTSVVAEERLKSSKKKKKIERGDIDAEAAAIILQDFLESFSHSTGSSGTSPSGNKKADKAKLQAKKAKHKLGGTKKTVILVLLLALVIGGVTFGVFWFKDLKAREREDYYRQLESEMEARTFDFTIRPGESIFDIKKHLLMIDRNGGQAEGEQIPKYTAEEIDAALVANYDFDFLDGRPEGSTLEGYLYPETYNFYGESTVEEIFTKFLEKMGKVIHDADLEEKYRAHGLSLYEGITLASVVQKEASSPEQPVVAQVFLSRLANGMSLGSDVTVSYALDKIDPDRQSHSDNAAALNVDSCYNTRIHGGLPCGPISNPGLSALVAVGDPANTSYLYFLTGDDGVMYYSYTDSEHNQNILSHCQKLCNVSL